MWFYRCPDSLLPYSCCFSFSVTVKLFGFTINSCCIIQSEQNALNDLVGLTESPGPWWLCSKAPGSYNFEKRFTCSVCLQLYSLTGTWGGENWIKEQWLFCHRRPTATWNNNTQTELWTSEAERPLGCDREDFMTLFEFYLILIHYFKSYFLLLFAPFFWRLKLSLSLLLL